MTLYHEEVVLGKRTIYKVTTLMLTKDNNLLIPGSNVGCQVESFLHLSALPFLCLLYTFPSDGQYSLEELVLSPMVPSSRLMITDNRGSLHVYIRHVIYQISFWQIALSCVENLYFFHSLATIRAAPRLFSGNTSILR